LQSSRPSLTCCPQDLAPLIVEKGLPGKDKACGDAWTPSAFEELRAFCSDNRELDSNPHSFERIDGYCCERKVWSFDLAPFEGVIAPRAIVDQCLRDRVSAAGCQIWYRAQATDLHVSGHQIELTTRGEPKRITSRRRLSFWRPAAAVRSLAGRGSTASRGWACPSRLTCRATETSRLPRSCSASLRPAIRGSFPWAQTRRTQASLPSPKSPRRSFVPR